MNMTSSFLAVLILLFPFPDAPANCESGIWARHDAFNSVFSYFPNRIDFSVDGYIASSDCKNIGRKGSLFLGGNVYGVSVADCLNRNSAAPQSYKGDIDARIWYHSGVLNRPNEATVCWED